MHSKKVSIIARIAAALALLILMNNLIVAPVRGADVRLPFRIVQLGDSYSAGNGARSAAGERNYVGVPGCDRSPTNWGSQYAESLNDTYAVSYINRACSGGVIANIKDADQEIGDVKKVDGKCPEPAFPAEEYYTDISSDKCKHFAKTQIDAVNASVDLVLMTVGGNDMHFSSIVEDCYSIKRNISSCKDDVTYAMGQLNDPNLFKKNLVALFGKIKDKLRPGAKIAYVSYPYLSMNKAYVLTFPFEADYDAGTAIKTLSDKGQEVQAAAVKEANAAAPEDYIYFVDNTKDKFSGHEPDPSLIFMNPKRWIKEFEGNVFNVEDKKEMYHPNPLGHENWADLLETKSTFGVDAGFTGRQGNIDVVFVVDTTGSMQDDINQVKTDLGTLVQQLKNSSASYRIALVTYRDYPARTGWSGDYPSKVNQAFTSDPNVIQAAINALIADGGGDTPETVFSGIQAAINLPWRQGVTKTMIVIGDAPPLSPEPYSNLTKEQIIANSLAVDPVQVVGVNTGGLNDNGAIAEIAAGTGGSVEQGTSGLTTTISEIIDKTTNQPFAWLGAGYSGKIGQPITFDASGSFDPSGELLTKYEWDFEADGVYDLTTDVWTAAHTYNTAYNGLVKLRVTGPGGTALATAPVLVNDEGFVSQDDLLLPCPLDADGYSVWVNPDGSEINCIADHLPVNGIPGVGEKQFIYLPIVMH